MDGEIAPDELRSLLGEEGLRIVDVREPGAFRRRRLPGSVNVPFRELPGRVEELAGADRVVTVCPHGEASVGAARIVAAYEGVDGRVESLAGGLAAWDGPVETGAPGERGPDDASDRGGPDAPF